MSLWGISVSLCALFILSACVGSGADKPAVGSSSQTSGPFTNAGTCMTSHEWAGFRFNVELSQGKQDSLHVKVDMSEASWDVGVVEAWLEAGGKKNLPTQASKGAVINNESSNVPSAVGASGMLFDSVRNRNVGGNSKIGTAVTTTAGMVMAEGEAQARKQQFDAATSRWSGNFQLASSVDCGSKLWVRYWLPGEGVAGRRAIDIGHCFCEQRGS